MVSGQVNDNGLDDITKHAVNKVPNNSGCFIDAFTGNTNAIPSSANDAVPNTNGNPERVT
jgi:hypothetical protein